MTMDQLNICYKIKLLQTKDIGATALHMAMQQIVGVPVVQVIRPVKQDGVQVPDHNYWEVTFKTATCPSLLKRVSCILVDGAPILVHHHQTRFNIPCFRCYNPGRPAPSCKIRDDQQVTVRAKFIKVVNERISTVPTISPKRDQGAYIVRVTEMLHKAIARHLAEDEMSKDQAGEPAMRDLDGDEPTFHREATDTHSNRDAQKSSAEPIRQQPEPRRSRDELFNGHRLTAQGREAALALGPGISTKRW
ncbi:hypothetical protein V7S43_004387 [Phytophthora oleae]|uniref:Zinc knuckle CX2CX3GHX4C domain-containing protein n=1 Tax=Phytophthora oleae TaxID=2107226 RepID=A0ABD3FUF1_9STRA